MDNVSLDGQHWLQEIWGGKKREFSQRKLLRTQWMYQASLQGTASFMDTMGNLNQEKLLKNNLFIKHQSTLMAPG